MSFTINKTMKQLTLMHGTLQGMYTDDYDTVHGDMVILRHYVHDDYINIHFKFSNRKFNLVWDYVTEKDEETEQVTKRERWSIWTINKKTKDVTKKEYSWHDIRDLKFL